MVAAEPSESDVERTDSLEPGVNRIEAGRPIECTGFGKGGRPRSPRTPRVRSAQGGRLEADREGNRTAAWCPFALADQFYVRHGGRQPPSRTAPWLSPRARALDLKPSPSFIAALRALYLVMA